MKLKKTNRLICTLCLLVLALPFVTQTITTQAAESTSDWSMFHYNAAHTGATNSLAPKSSPTIVWQAGPTDPYNYVSNPIVANGIAYVSDGFLYAYNSTTGEKLWTIINDNGNAIAVDHGILYSGTSGAAYNATTGKKLWTIDISKSIAVANGYLYTCQLNSIVARNSTTGTIIWTIKGSANSIPAVENSHIYISSAGITALNASTGTIIWYKFTAPVFSSPAVTSDKVYFGSDKILYCLDAATGGKVWSYITNSSIFSSPSVADGLVYVGSNDGNLYALNASTGAKIWNYTTYIGGDGLYGVSSSPAVADGSVYVGSDDGNLYAFDALTGTKLWNYTIQSKYSTFGGRQHLSSSPAIVDGKIYISSKDHIITVLEEGLTTSTSNSTIVIFIIGCILVVIVITVIYRYQKRG
jgi:eukaryotic-like serine/threonine-protein kinase